MRYNIIESLCCKCINSTLYIPLRYQHTAVTKHKIKPSIAAKVLLKQQLVEHRIDNQLQTVDQLSTSIQSLLSSLNKQLKQSNLPMTSSQRTLKATRHAQLINILEQTQRTLSRHNTDVTESTALIDELHSIIEKFEQLKIIQIRDYTRLVGIYATQSNAITLANQLLNKIHNGTSLAKLDTILYNSLIDLYMTHNDMTKALQLYHNMIAVDSKYRATVDMHTYVTLINGLCRAGNIKYALQLFEQARIQKNELSNNTRLYSVMIRGLAANGDTVSAFALLRSLASDNINRPNVRITISLFNSVLSGLTNYDDIERLMKSMYYFKVEPNAVTIQTLLKSYGSTDLLQCLNLIERILRGKYNLPLPTPDSQPNNVLLDIGHQTSILELVQANNTITTLTKYMILHRFARPMRSYICDLRLYNKSNKLMKLYIQYYMFIQSLMYTASNELHNVIRIVVGRNKTVQTNDMSTDATDDVFIDDDDTTASIHVNKGTDLSTTVQNMLRQLTPSMQCSDKTTDGTYVIIPQSQLYFYLARHSTVLQQYASSITYNNINDMIKQLQSGELLYDALEHKLSKLTHQLQPDVPRKMTFDQKVQHNIAVMYQFRTPVDKTEKQSNKPADIDTVIEKLQIDRYNSLQHA